MSSLKTRNSALSQMEAVKSAWNEIRTELENEKAQIYEQIGHYPSPIAGCDQQFNHLLEQQRQIVRELARLNEAENERLTAADPIKAIEDFIRSSPYIDSELAWDAVLCSFERQNEA
jgi:DNA repair ATPase RecN